MNPQDPNSVTKVMQEEKAGWEEIQVLVDGLKEEQAEIIGYTAEWSVKDFLAHLAGWLAAAGSTLEQVKTGTHVLSEVDVDSRNKIYVEANRDQPLEVVLYQVKAARRRVLRTSHGLAEIPSDAESAIRKAGPEHYAEHIPRLREWVAELQS